MKGFVLVCALIVVTASSPAAVLKQWDFSEAAGTLAYQTVNTGTAAGTFNSTGAGNFVTTDGNGALILDNTITESHSSGFGADLETGHACIRVEFTAWDLTDLRHSADTYMGSVLFTESAGLNGSLVGIKRSVSGANLTLGGLTAVFQSDYLTLDLVSTDSLSVILDRDLDANTVDAWYRFGNDAPGYTYLTTFGTTIYHARRVQITNLDRVGWVDNYVAIGGVAVTTSLAEALAIPEPASVMFLGIFGGSCLWVRRMFKI